MKLRPSHSQNICAYKKTDQSIRSKKPSWSSSSSLPKMMHEVREWLHWRSLEHLVLKTSSKDISTNVYNTKSHATHKHLFCEASGQSTIEDKESIRLCAQCIHQEKQHAKRVWWLKHLKITLSSYHQDMIRRSSHPSFVNMMIECSLRSLACRVVND